MRTAFLRAPDEAEARVPTTGHGVLDAYNDLSTDAGPIHARSVAEAGRHLLAGEPVPLYQINTPSLLRRYLAAETGPGCAVSDPREVAAEHRGPAWSLLCERIEDWPTLDAGIRMNVAAVLTKLGFWETVLRIVPDTVSVTRSPDHARLAYFRCNAALKAHGPTRETLGRAQGVMAEIARSGLPVPNRLSAAVNLIVHHAKSDRSPSQLRIWHELADTLVRQADPDEIGPVRLSLYWRGVSFLPFFAGDHHEVRAMLDRAEELGREAVDRATPAERLLAAENMHPLLETRGRAANAAGDRETAERYYRELVAHDPYDAKTHIRLGDHLLADRRPEEARRHYQDAAVLGVPYTAYAHTQAARCSIRLGERERAVASLVQAVRSDPNAVTPLAMLQDLLPGTPLAALRPWAAARLRELLENLGNGDR